MHARQQARTHARMLALVFVHTYPRREFSRSLRHARQKATLALASASVMAMRQLRARHVSLRTTKPMRPPDLGATFFTTRVCAPLNSWSGLSMIGSNSRRIGLDIC